MFIPPKVSCCKSYELKERIILDMALHISQEVSGTFLYGKGLKLKNYIF